MKLDWCVNRHLSISGLDTVSDVNQAKPAPVSTGPETEEQVKKRKRDEYLSEMAKYRNSSCGEGGGKHSLVK